MSISITGIPFLMLCILCIAGIGYLLGRITIKGVSLGTAGTFIVALIFGCLFYDQLESVLAIKDASGEVIGNYTSQALKIVENLGLILFVAAVGFIAGPGFFANMKKNFKSYALLGLVISLLGTLTTAACILIGQNFTDLSLRELTAMLVGILSGSLTSTPAFAAAKESVADVVTPEITLERLENLVTVGHGIAYIFGVIGVVLFVQLVPKIVKANMQKEVALISDTAGENTEKKSKLGKLIEIDSFGIAPLVIAGALGIVIGNIKIAGFSLTTTGGTLLVSLLFGHFARIGKMSIMPPESTLKVLREFGLVLFLIGAGVAGGAEFLAEFEVIYFVYGVIITIIPMILGFLFSKYVLKLSLLNNLGSLTGGMTSTPALGTLINVAGTENVAASYAATYPLALVTIVIFSKLLIMFIK